jgi:hypothetical protein
LPDPTFEETPERREIVETLAKAVRLLHERAEMHRHNRSEVRTNRALNRAQTVQLVIDMLALDWTQDDAGAVG